MSPDVAPMLFGTSGNQRVSTYSFEQPLGILCYSLSCDTGKNIRSEARLEVNFMHFTVYCFLAYDVGIRSENFILLVKLYEINGVFIKPLRYLDTEK